MKKHRNTHDTQQKKLEDPISQQKTNDQQEKVSTTLHNAFRNTSARSVIDYSRSNRK